MIKISENKMQPDGLGKFKKSLHRVLDPQPSGL
jgi:hypothetical protein